MKKILVIGGSGYVGKNFGLTIPNKYFLKTYYSKKKSNYVFFDLSNSKLDDIDIDYNQYSHVIIAAGVVRFNDIIDRPVESKCINVNCTKGLIEEIVKKGLIPVFISSESVFDGRNGNFTENHEPNPIFEPNESSASSNSNEVYFFVPSFNISIMKFVYPSSLLFS